MPKTARRTPSPKDVVKAQFTVTRAQVVALRREALERQARGDPGRADASAVLREILDAWLATRPGA
jgi:hypothetical protein